MSSSSLSRLDPDNTETLWNDQQFVWFVVVGLLGITLGMVEAIRYDNMTYKYQRYTISRSYYDLSRNILVLKGKSAKSPVEEEENTC